MSELRDPDDTGDEAAMSELRDPDDTGDEAAMSELRDPDDIGDGDVTSFIYLYEKAKDGPAPEVVKLDRRMRKLRRAYDLITHKCPPHCLYQVQLEEYIVIAVRLFGNNGRRNGSDPCVAAMVKSCWACNRINSIIDRSCSCEGVGAQLRGLLPI